MDAARNAPRRQVARRQAQDRDHRHQRHRLESGQAPLEESIALYEEGARLKAHCEERLKAAQLRVDKIVVGPDGQARGVEAASFE